MENKKSGLITGIIIGFLIAVIAGLVVYIALDKKDSDDKSKEDKKQTTETKKEEKKDEDVISYEYTSYAQKSDGTHVTGMVDVDTTKYTNIFDYIDDQENVKVIIDYYEKVGEEPVNKQYELTASEKTTFINNMKKSTIEARLGGLGGALTSSIDVKYTRNGEEKYVRIYQTVAISSSNDINIYKIMDDNATAKDVDANNYMIKNFDNTIYDLVNNVN